MMTEMRETERVRLCLLCLGDITQIWERITSEGHDCRLFPATKATDHHNMPRDDLMSFVFMVCRDASS